MEVTVAELVSIAKTLKREGARNINYVGGDPTPSTWIILDAIRRLGVEGVNIPQLWNSNMYCSKECIELLLDLMDFWLPDFKYGNNDCAEKLSKVKSYWEVVSRNHKIVHDQTVEEGSSGMIIRHLVLPGHIECCTRPVLEWIAENCSKALVNVMAQYYPTHLVPKSKEHHGINRRVSSEEMQKAYSIADELGLLWRPVS